MITKIAIHREIHCCQMKKILQMTTVLQMNVSYNICNGFRSSFTYFFTVLLNSDELNASGSGNNKLGMHIKSEDSATDPLAGTENSVNNNFGPMNQSSQNRSLISQNSPDRIQPLPSNVVNKQSNSMDVSEQL